MPADAHPVLPSPDEREALLYRRLSALDIAWTTYSHAPVFTVEEAQHLRGTLTGTHTKNLFLDDRKGGLWLICAREDLAVDLNALSKMLPAPRFSFASAEKLVETLGIMPGSVSPFALINDSGNLVRLILDAGMLVADPINFHPLRNDRTTAISAIGLLAFLRSTGHEPLVLALPERHPRAEP